MSKWKCGICGSKFDNFQAQGFEGTIYCPLCYYKKLYKDTELKRERLNKRIEDLNIINEEHQLLNGMIRKELQQKENIIKEVREYITSAIENDDIEEFKNARHIMLWNEDLDKLLEILDKENK